MSIELIILGLVGITVIITAGSIFEEIRNKVSESSVVLGKLINCPMCTGFWIGFFFGFTVDMGPAIIVGGLVSLLSWTIYSIVDYFVTKGTWYATRIISETETGTIEGEENES
jgi:integral membrane sensor domain MASE1